MLVTSIFSFSHNVFFHLLCCLQSLSCQRKHYHKTFRSSNFIVQKLSFELSTDTYSVPLQSSPILVPKFINSNPLLHVDVMWCCARLDKQVATKDLRTGGGWFDPKLARPRFILRIDDSHCDGVHSSLAAVYFFHDCGEAPSGLERTLCGVLVKRTPGKHG